MGDAARMHCASRFIDEFNPDLLSRYPVRVGQQYTVVSVSFGAGTNNAVGVWAALQPVGEAGESLEVCLVEDVFDPDFSDSDDVCELLQSLLGLNEDDETLDQLRARLGKVRGD